MPRDGAGVLRGPARGGPAQRRLHLRQGGQGGAARHRQRLHGRLPDAHGQRRMAPDHTDGPRQNALLRGHVYPQGGEVRSAGPRRYYPEGERAMEDAAGRIARLGRAARGASPPFDGACGPDRPFGRDAGRGLRGPRGPLRRDKRRLRACPQVSHPAQHDLPPAPLEAQRRRPRPRDGGKDAQGDATGRRIRPRGVRVSPVFDGRGWLVPHFEKMLYDQAMLQHGLP